MSSLQTTQCQTQLKPCKTDGLKTKNVTVKWQHTKWKHLISHKEQMQPKEHTINQLKKCKPMHIETL